VSTDQQYFALFCFVFMPLQQLVTMLSGNSESKLITFDAQQ